MTSQPIVTASQREELLRIAETKMSKVTAVVRWAETRFEEDEDFDRQYVLEQLIYEIKMALR